MRETASCKYASHAIHINVKYQTCYQDKLFILLNTKCLISIAGAWKRSVYIACPLRPNRTYHQEPTCQHENRFFSTSSLHLPLSTVGTPWWYSPNFVIKLNKTNSNSNDYRAAFDQKCEVRGGCKVKMRWRKGVALCGWSVDLEAGV